MADDNSWDSIFQSYDDLSKAYESNTGAGTATGNVNVNPNSTGYGYAIRRNGDVSPGSYSTPGGNLITISGGGGGGSSQQSASAVPSGGSKSSGGSGYGKSSGYSLGYQGEKVAMPKYNAPEFNAPDAYKAPEYKPPEYDEALEKQLRDEYSAPGMRQVRKSTSQAILSSASLDNPMAQSLFMEKALSGVGDAISSVMSSAGKEARSAAQTRYQNDLQTYNFGWQGLQDEAIRNYESEWNAAVMDYNSQVWGAQNDYNLQANVFGQMPLDYQASQINESTGYKSDKWGGNYNKWFAANYG